MLSMYQVKHAASPRPLPQAKVEKYEAMTLDNLVMVDKCK